MAPTSANRTLPRRIDTVGWAVFFIWVGVALLADVGWTWAVIGTGAVVLAVQAASYLTGGGIDAFMSAVGVVLVGGAVADVYGSPWSLIPAFLIVIGLAMLVDTVRGNRRTPPSGT